MSSTEEVADAVHRIAESAPDMILNTLAADRNVPFTRALRAAGVTPDRAPTSYCSVSETGCGPTRAGEGRRSS